MVTSRASEGVEECGWLRLQRTFQSGGGKAVARWTVGIGWNDVQQIRRNTGVGQVRGDASAHGARTQNSDLLYPFRHGMYE